MNLDSTLAVTNTCPKDGVHLCRLYFRYWARSGMRYDPNPLDTNVEMSASIRRFRGI